MIANSEIPAIYFLFVRMEQFVRMKTSALFVIYLTGKAKLLAFPEDITLT